MGDATLSRLQGLLNKLLGYGLLYSVGIDIILIGYSKVLVGIFFILCTCPKTSIWK